MQDDYVLNQNDVIPKYSASSIINKVYNLFFDSELNQSKLKLSHQALVKKIAVFDKFDGEILELLSENELGEQIDQANLFTIIYFDQTFKVCRGR